MVFLPGKELALFPLEKIYKNDEGQKMLTKCFASGVRGVDDCWA